MRGPWQFEEPSCAEIGTELFFADDKEDTSEMKLARTICNSCTHKTECLEWAIAHEEVGIWGGTTGNQRRKIKRMRKKDSA